MWLRRVNAVWALLGGALLVACGEDGRPSGSSDEGAAGVAAVGGSGAVAGVGHANPSVGGAGFGGTADGTASAGVGDAASGAGQAGAPMSTVGRGGAEATCGNAVREASEQCDGADVGGFECADLGFDSGALDCGPDCALLLSGCTGVEDCLDGRDNDGDHDIDCSDSDCSSACASSCDAIAELDENGTVAGTLAGRSSELSPGCSRSPDRSEVVYAVTVSDDGYLDATLSAASGATLSARLSCADDESQIGCVADTTLEALALAGETVYLVVEGDTSDGFGFFELSVRRRVAGCGNAVRENDEGCDDGNTESGDGCDDQCELESTEVESNRSFRRANEYTLPFFAEISDELDQDYVELVVNEPPVGFRVDTFDLGDGACSKNELDSSLELYAPDQETVLAEDDDGGQGYCASIDVELHGAEAGSYFVVVSSSSSGSVHQFPYLLNAVVELCGNGVTSPGEDCDDGGRANFDGCSEICTTEL